MMSDGTSSTAAAAPASAPEHDGPSGSGIDLDALVDKVYRLFVAEIRLGQARGETLRGRRS